MDLMFDHGCRKELTLAAQDEERETKWRCNNLKMYGIFRSSHLRTAHGAVTTNKFTQTIHTTLDSILQSFYLYLKFILSRVSLFAVIL